MAEASIRDITHPRWRDEEIARLKARVSKLEAALAEIKTVTDFTTFHGHLMEGNDAGHKAHRIARKALANEQSS